MIGNQFGQRFSEKKTFKRVRRHWLTVAFFLGFLFDVLTLNRVDDLLDNIILAFYVTLAMISLLLLYASTAERFPEKSNDFVRKYSPLLVQYSFGGLISGMLIFYGRSGDWLESWPFLLIFIFIIYLNETVKDRVSRLLYNLAIFFIGLFSYVVLVIPVFTGYMGPWVFVGSGLVALFVMYWFVQALYKIIPRFLELQMRPVVFLIGLIFASFNFLYFANIIPPIPLSLKEIGIYHSVISFPDRNQYQLKFEEGAWWQFFKKSDDVYHARAGDQVFCFAKVFTPTRLNIDIYHRWEYYDEEKGQWMEHFRGSYPINGDNDRGYRGYTLIQNYRDGEWRCSVETERGQVLGRENFRIDSSEEPRALETRLD